MTDKKSAVDKALEAEQALQEKVALKAFALRKKMNRKDFRDAVEALETPVDEWSDIDALIVVAYKVDPGKGWEHYINLSQGELEEVIVGK